MTVPRIVNVIAEVGLNHQGDLGIAKQLIDVAKDAGCDVVKFQKRTPELCLPKKLWYDMRDTPFGRMNYIDYRRRIEFGFKEYAEINLYCSHVGIAWTASPWDIESVYFLKQFMVPFYKVASPTITNIPLLQTIAAQNKPVCMSTGMSTEEEVRKAVRTLEEGGVKELALMVCTSTYPAAIADLNLARIETMMTLFPEYVIGYSGHETGLWTTLCAVAMGAKCIERHITLDRAMVGSDHGASVEPGGLKLLVREIRAFETALGDGKLGICEAEKAVIERLRG